MEIERYSCGGDVHTMNVQVPAAHESELEYYSRRASEEAAAADAASDGRAAEVHRKLSEKYASLAHVDADKRSRTSRRLSIRV
jgi:muconolactone delta-isomerase